MVQQEAEELVDKHGTPRRTALLTDGGWVLGAAWLLAAGSFSALPLRFLCL